MLREAVEYLVHGEIIEIIIQAEPPRVAPAECPESHA